MLNRLALLQDVSNAHLSPPSCHQFPLVILQQQPIVCVERGQHLGAHHPSVGLSAQCVCRPRQLDGIGRIQRVA